MRHKHFIFLYLFILGNTFAQDKLVCSGSSIDKIKIALRNGKVNAKDAIESFKKEK